MFLHGDYHIENIIVCENNSFGIIDWELARYGDPAEDFVRVFVSAMTSPYYAIGQIEGYFGETPPQDFWDKLFFFSMSELFGLINLNTDKYRQFTRILLKQLLYEYKNNKNTTTPQFYNTYKGELL